MNKKAEKYLLSLVSQGYENIAESFNASRKKPMKKMIYDIVEDLKIREGARVLDLACGNGCFFELVPSSAYYLGIDQSKNLIDYARKDYGDKFIVLDMLSLNKLQEKDFDYIFSWATFHHIPGNSLRLDFLEKVSEKLKKDGLFAFSVWKLRQKNNFFKIFFQSFFQQLLKLRIIDFGDLIFYWKADKTKSRQARYYHAFSKKELLRLISKSKLSLSSFLEDEYNYYIILKK